MRSSILGCALEHIDEDPSTIEAPKLGPSALVQSCLGSSKPITKNRKTNSTQKNKENTIRKRNKTERIKLNSILKT